MRLELESPYKACELDLAVIVPGFLGNNIQSTLLPGWVPTDTDDMAGGAKSFRPFWIADLNKEQAGRIFWAVTEVPVGTKAFAPNTVLPVGLCVLTVQFCAS